MSEEAQSAAETRPAFKVGDVVRLRSGGAEMTVEGLRDDAVECVWLRDGYVERDALLNKTVINLTIVREHESRMARELWAAQAALRSDEAKARASQEAQLKANEPTRSWFWTGR